MLETIISWFVTAIGEGIEWLVDLFLRSLTLSLTTIVNTFPLLATAYETFQYIGMGLILVMAGWQLIKFFGGEMTELTDTPMMILIRSFIAGILIWFGGNIVEYVFNLAQVPYDYIVSKDAVTWGTSSLFNNFLSAVGTDGVTATLAVGVGGATVGTAIAVTAATELLLSLVLIGLIGYNIIKLLLEICERYLLVGVLAYCAPLLYPFICSKATSMVFKKWVGMFLGQCALMTISGWSLQLILSGFSTDSEGHLLFMSLILTLAMCKIAQRMDTYMQQLGIGVGTTGGNLLDEAAGLMMAFGHNRTGNKYGGERSSKNSILGAGKDGSLSRFGGLFGGISNTLQKGVQSYKAGNSLGSIASGVGKNFKEGFSSGTLNAVFGNTSSARSIRQDNLKRQAVKDAVKGQKEFNNRTSEGEKKYQNPNGSGFVNTATTKGWDDDITNEQKSSGMTAQQYMQANRSTNGVGGISQDSDGRSELDETAKKAGMSWDNNYLEYLDDRNALKEELGKQEGDVLSDAEASAYNITQTDESHKISSRVPMTQEEAEAYNDAIGRTLNDTQAAEYNALQPNNDLKIEPNKPMTKEQEATYYDTIGEKLNPIEGAADTVGDYISQNYEKSANNEDINAALAATALTSSLAAEQALFNPFNELSGNDKLGDALLKSAIGEKEITGTEGGEFKNVSARNTKNGGRIISTDYYKDGVKQASYELYNNEALTGQQAAVGQIEQIKEGMNRFNNSKDSMRGVSTKEGNEPMTIRKLGEKKEKTSDSFVGTDTKPIPHEQGSIHKDNIGFDGAKKQTSIPEAKDTTSNAAFVPINEQIGAKILSDNFGDGLKKAASEEKNPVAKSNLNTLANALENSAKPANRRSANLGTISGITQSEDGNILTGNINNAAGKKVGEFTSLSEEGLQNQKAQGKDISGFTEFKGSNGASRYISINSANGLDSVDTSVKNENRMDDSARTISKEDRQGANAYRSLFGDGITRIADTGNDTKLQNNLSAIKAAVDNTDAYGNTDSDLPTVRDLNESKVGSGTMVSGNVISPNGEMLGNFKIVDNKAYEAMETAGTDVSKFSAYTLADSDGANDTPYYLQVSTPNGKDIISTDSIPLKDADLSSGNSAMETPSVDFGQAQNSNVTPDYQYRTNNQGNIPVTPHTANNNKDYTDVHADNEGRIQSEKPLEIGNSDTSHASSDDVSVDNDASEIKVDSSQGTGSVPKPLYESNDQESVPPAPSTSHTTLDSDNSIDGGADTYAGHSEIRRGNSGDFNAPSGGKAEPNATVSYASSNDVSVDNDASEIKVDSSQGTVPVPKPLYESNDQESVPTVPSAPHITPDSDNTIDGGADAHAGHSEIRRGNSGDFNAPSGGKAEPNATVSYASSDDVSDNDASEIKIGSSQGTVSVPKPLYESNDQESVPPVSSTPHVTPSIKDSDNSIDGGADTYAGHSEIRRGNSGDFNAPSGGKAESDATVSGNHSGKPLAEYTHEHSNQQSAEIQSPAIQASSHPTNKPMTSEVQQTTSNQGISGSVQEIKEVKTVEITEKRIEGEPPRRTETFSVDAPANSKTRLFGKDDQKSIEKTNRPFDFSDLNTDTDISILDTGINKKNKPRGNKFTNALKNKLNKKSSLSKSPKENNRKL